MDEASYAVGSIVWVKLTGGKWWPGEVVAPETCPEEVTKGLRKEPLAIVKFFDEDFYETVKSSSHIQPFACARKDDFIRKGRELLKLDPNADKFDKDVEEAMQLCGVTNEEQSDCSNSYDTTSLSNHYDPLPSENTLNYGSAMVASTPSECKPLASRIQPYGTYKTLELDSGSDVRIRAQPSPASAARGAAYACDMCSFQTNRIANIIVHHKSHSEQLRLLTYKMGSVKDRGAFSDGRVPRKKDSKLTLQKVKRKIFTDSDQESAKVKRKPKKADAAAKEATPHSGGDVVSSLKKRRHQVIGPDGNPVTKRKRKKEADPDTIFDKIKKQSAKKMSRKRGGAGFLHLGSLSSPHLKGLSKRKDGSDGSSDEAEFLISRGIYDNEEVADGEELSASRDDEELLPDGVEDSAALKLPEEAEMTVDNVDSQSESLAEPMEISETLPVAPEYSALTGGEQLPLVESGDFMPLNLPAAAERDQPVVESRVAAKEDGDILAFEVPEAFETPAQPAPVETASGPVGRDEMTVEEKIASLDDGGGLFFLDREPDKAADVFESDEGKNDESDAYLDRNESETREEIFLVDEPAEKTPEPALAKVAAFEDDDDDLVILSDHGDEETTAGTETAKRVDDYLLADDGPAKPVPDAFVEKEDTLVIDEASLESEAEIVEDDVLMLKSGETAKEQLVDVDADIKDGIFERVGEGNPLSKEDVDVMVEEFMVAEKAWIATDKEPEVISEESVVEIEELTADESLHEPCDGTAEGKLAAGGKGGHSPYGDDVEMLVRDTVCKENDVEAASSPGSAEDIFADDETIDHAEEIMLQEKITGAVRAIDDTTAENDGDAMAENDGDATAENDGDATAVAKVPEKEAFVDWEMKDDEIVVEEEEERPIVVMDGTVVDKNAVDAEEAGRNEVVDQIMGEIVGEVTAEQIKTSDETVEEAAVLTAADAKVEMVELPNSKETEVKVTSLPLELDSCDERKAEPVPSAPCFPDVVDLNALAQEAMVLSGGVVTDSSIIANIPIPPDPAPVCILPPPQQQLTCQLAPVVIEPNVLEYTKLQALIQQQQPQEMETVYLDPILDVPIVEGEEVIHLEGEQVIDTSMDVFCNEVVIESDDKEVQEEYDNICLVTDQDRVLLAPSEVVAVSQKADDEKVAKFGGSVQERPSVGEVTADTVNGTLSQTVIGGSICAPSTEIGQQAR